MTKLHLPNKNSAKRALHKAHSGCHLGYFAAAALEGHGAYSALAAALFVLSIVMLFTHAEGAE
jgi:hypothetical protein